MLSLCDLTTVTCRPWADAGHQCIAVDLQHGGERGHPRIDAYGLDVMDPRLDDMVQGAEFSFVAAFPPCTDLAVSGARWWAAKGPQAAADAIALVERCEELAVLSGAPYFIENPVGRLSTTWKKWDYAFHPYEYGGYEGGDGDGYTKKTCLWTGGGFVMPEPRPIPLDPGSHDRIHKAAPGPGRANLRSATPAGFARAVFEANR